MRSAFPAAHVVSFTTLRPRKRRHDLTITAVETSPRITRVAIDAVPSAVDNTSRHGFTDYDEKKKLTRLCLRQIQRVLIAESLTAEAQEHSLPCPWCDQSVPPEGSHESNPEPEDQELAQREGAPAEKPGERVLVDEDSRPHDLIPPLQVRHRYQESSDSLRHALERTRLDLLQGRDAVLVEEAGLHVDDETDDHREQLRERCVTQGDSPRGA
jgi:hypothetical protein